MSTMVNESENVRWRRLVVVLPLVVFSGLVLLFLIGLRAGDPSRIPSALIGKPAPETNMKWETDIVRHGPPACPTLSYLRTCTTIAECAFQLGHITHFLKAILQQKPRQIPRSGSGLMRPVTKLGTSASLLRVQQL